jgi:hypothetical protein
MSALIGMIYSLAVVSSLINSAEQGRLLAQIDAASRVAVGQSQAEVRAIVGAPIGEWEKTGFIFTSGPPQWAFGTVLDAHEIIQDGWVLPLPIPLKLRIFGPDGKDLVITWDDAGRVVDVKRP